jgi:signal transduction histidine kinase
MYSDLDLNITIEDDGCGMPKNFELNKESNGLANIYDRVKVLNGEISFLSNSDEGTCFTLNFPNLTLQQNDL